MKLKFHFRIASLRALCPPCPLRLFRALLTVVGLGIGIAGFSRPAFALTLLPETRHHQSLTHALFSEEQSAIYRLGASTAWIAVGGSITVAEFEETRFRPQVSIVGLAKTWMEISREKALLLPQTIDAHAGITVDLELSSVDRVSTGWYHLSGHAADEINDKTLLTGNVGTEVLFIRYVRDVFDGQGRGLFRLGATLKPVLGSDPPITAFGADQFIEYFPGGRSPDPRVGAPYLSFGVEEVGARRLQATLHTQIGYAFGSHFSSSHIAENGGVNPDVKSYARTGALRVVAGYYSGHDPRLKYFEMRNSRLSFFYAGLGFNF